MIEIENDNKNKKNGLSIFSHSFWFVISFHLHWKLLKIVGEYIQCLGIGFQPSYLKDHIYIVLL